MKDENDNKPKTKRSDTLNYYNDSLPRKAVESLFDKPSGDSPAGRPRAENDDDGVSGVRFQENLGYKDKTSLDDDLEDHISLYSKSNTQKTRKDYYTGPVSAKRPVFPDEAQPQPGREGYERRADELIRPSYGGEQRRYADEAPQRPRQGAAYQPGPDGDGSARYARRAPIDDLPRRARETDPARQKARADEIERRRLESEQRRKTQYSNNSLKDRKSARLFDADDYDDGAALPVRVIIMSVIAAAVLLVFIALIVKINSLNAQLVKYSSDEDALGEATEQLTLARMEIDRLTDDVKYLQNLVDSYKTALPAPNGAGGAETDAPAETDTDARPPAPPVTNPSNSNTGSSSGTDLTYYSVVSGDTLSKISKKFYNDPGLFKKIMDANNLTSDTLTVGQKLIIP